MNGWTTSELKEATLSLLGLIWGILFLLPGNLLAAPPGVSTLMIFATDWVWGWLLVVASLALFFLRAFRFRIWRGAAHAFFWVFWMGIGVLALTRTMWDGFQPLDILLPSVFMALAFLHAILYIALWRKP